jgi:hypothetical protein
MPGAKVCGGAVCGERCDRQRGWAGRRTHALADCAAPHSRHGRVADFSPAPRPRPHPRRPGSAPDHLQVLYKRVCEYLELDTRVEVLNTRFVVLQEFLDLLREHTVGRADRRVGTRARARTGPVGP